jgi:hypothetical protein
VAVAAAFLFVEDNNAGLIRQAEIFSTFSIAAHNH